MKVLEVVGCRSLAIRTLVAKAEIFTLYSLLSVDVTLEFHVERISGSLVHVSFTFVDTSLLVHRCVLVLPL